MIDEVPHYRRSDMPPDRRWLDWHYTLPKSWTLIDLDACIVCHECHRTLVLVELTVNPKKSTYILRQLAVELERPAWLITLPEEVDVPTLDDETWIKVRKLHPLPPWGYAVTHNIRQRSWRRYEGIIRSQCHQTEAQRQ